MTNKYEKNLGWLPINNSSHLNNHLNYLCRTDSEQKWTNELTGGNVYIFQTPSGSLKLATANDADERKIFKDLVKGRIKKEAAARGLTLGDFSTKLKQLRSDYMDENACSFTQTIKADTLELLRAVSESVSGFQLVCAVVHVDQEDCYLHLHVLYFEKDANKT